MQLYFFKGKKSRTLSIVMYHSIELLHARKVLFVHILTSVLYVCVVFLF